MCPVSLWALPHTLFYSILTLTMRCRGHFLHLKEKQERWDPKASSDLPEDGRWKVAQLSLSAHKSWADAGRLAGPGGSVCVCVPTVSPHGPPWGGEHPGRHISVPGEGLRA